jgi:hypothetical protein
VDGAVPRARWRHPAQRHPGPPSTAAAVSDLDRIDDLITTARPPRGRHLISVISVHEDLEVRTMKAGLTAAIDQIDDILLSRKA